MYEIPLVDIREADPVQLLKLHIELARTLIGSSRDVFGIASRVASYAAFPLADLIARKWLEKTDNPYRQEILELDRILGGEGVIGLNLCYEWGCTSGVYKKNGSATLTRVLDWPFPKLGETVLVTHQRGKAGDFYNVTWPGLAGTFNAMAPGRFAAAINQAPMRRYITGLPIDWAINRRRMYKANGLPPAHLLRKVFETASTYQEAKEMLSREPICIPVIFALSGTNENEACVIERLETEYAIREMEKDRVCVSNHFETWLNGIGYGWMPRPIDSPGRIQTARAVPVSAVNATFDWFTPPIANEMSRIAIVADAGQKTLAVIGTSGATPVSKTFIL